MLLCARGGSPATSGVTRSAVDIDPPSTWASEIRKGGGAVDEVVIGTAVEVWDGAVSVTTVLDSTRS
jgi:hypothetical protein